MSNFDPKKNLIFKCFKFNTRVQLPGESIDIIVLTLYALAKECDYSTAMEDMIGDKIVIGIRDSKISERLKLKSDLILATAILKLRQAVAQGQKEDEQTSISAPNTENYLIP